MNTTLHPFKRRDIPDVLSRALKRAHGSIPETLTGRAFSKVKVWFIDRYPKIHQNFWDGVPAQINWKKNWGVKNTKINSKPTFTLP